MSNDSPQYASVVQPLPPAAVDEDLTAWPLADVERYKRLGVWTEQTLDAALRAVAERSPRAIALVCGSRRVSYDELWTKVERLATGLEGLGLAAGATVVVQLPNVLEAVVVYFALFRLGAVPVLALPGHRTSELESFIEQTGAVGYITIDTFEGFDHRGLARTLRARMPSLEHVLILGEPEEFRDLSVLDGEAQQREHVSASSVALLQLSGGSTGVPKLIPRTHRDYAYSVRQSIELCELSSRTRYLAVLPMAHNFIMSSPGFLGCLFAGGTVILCQDASPSAVLRLLSQEEITLVAAVPPLAMTWLRAAHARDAELPRGLTLQVGGAKLSPEDASQLYAALRGRLQQVFGMAEGLVCYTPLGARKDEVLQTQGRPMSPYDEVRVVDDEDLPVAVGQTGHLLARGPYTIRGYYRAAEHNRAAFTLDGFYRTGDLVRMTASGSVVVVGRAKEQINRAGEKVAPAELERHLGTHPQVLAVAVLGLSDPVLGQRIAAFVETSNDVALGKAELQGFLRARGIAEYKLPDEVHCAPDLPRTSAGKLDKNQLRVAYGGDAAFDSKPGSPAEVQLVPTSDATGPLDLVAELSRLLGVSPGELTPETNLIDAGLDSLRLMTLVERFQGEGRELSFMELAEEPTLGNFTRMLEMSA